MRIHAIVLLLCWLLAAAPGAARAGSVQVEDAKGRVLEIETPVRRVVVLSDDAMEITRLLGRSDRVVGASSYIKSRTAFYPEIAELPDVGRSFTPNLESIVRLKPDVLVAWSKWPGPETEEKLEPFGVKVLRLDLFLPEHLEREVRTLARVYEAEDAAEEYLAWNKARIEELLSRLPSPDRRPKVFTEAYSPLRAYGPGAGTYGLSVLAGGRNIAEELRIQSALVDTEWVVRNAPEVIIKAVSSKSEDPAEQQARLDSLRDEILTRPGWNLIPAVATGRVHALCTDISGGPRMAVGLAWMLRWLYPDSCADLDPDSIHRDYLRRFQRLEYEGIFVSTPVEMSRP